MAVPVTFAILTSIAAFFPLLLVPGVSGKFFRLIPLVVISVLILSLIESFFVLPAHLAHLNDKKPGFIRRMMNIPRKSIAVQLERFINGPFDALVRRCVQFRYISLAVALSFFFTAGRLADRPTFPCKTGRFIRTPMIVLAYPLPKKTGDASNTSDVLNKT